VTPNAAATSNLTGIVFWIAAVVFVVVEGLLMIAIFKFRKKSKEDPTKSGMPKQVEGNRVFETLWTMAPTLVLAVLFILTFITLQSVIQPPQDASAAAAGPNVMHIQVTGHQWWWQFDYPAQKITTADEIHIPIDTVVMVDIKSADVIHSFWVPQFGGKVDAIPGHNNNTWFKASQTGVFKGECGEYCGAEHAQMAFQVIVDSPEDFQTWVKGQQASAVDVHGDAAEGKLIFMTGACSGCHGIQGTNAAGKTAPNLTHLASRKIFSGGVLNNTPENLTKWVSNPETVKPGTLMPTLGLSQDEVAKLVAYLETLK